MIYDNNDRVEEIESTTNSNEVKYLLGDTYKIRYGNDFETTEIRDKAIKALKGHPHSLYRLLKQYGVRLHKNEIKIWGFIKDFGSNEEDADYIYEEAKRLKERNIIRSISSSEKFMSLGYGEDKRALVSILNMYDHNAADFRTDNKIGLTLDHALTCPLDCKLVTGTTEELTDKSSHFHIWVEANIKGKEFCIDPEANVIVSKNAYYDLRHVKTIQKVDKADLIRDLRKVLPLIRENKMDIMEYLTMREDVMENISEDENR